MPNNLCLDYFLPSKREELAGNIHSILSANAYCLLGKKLASLSAFIYSDLEPLALIPFAIETLFPSASQPSTPSIYLST